jgi:hypothetical protein
VDHGAYSCALRPHRRVVPDMTVSRRWVSRSHLLLNSGPLHGGQPTPSPTTPGPPTDTDTSSPRGRLPIELPVSGPVNAVLVVVSVETLKIPHVPKADRVEVDDLGYRDDGIMHISVRYGFQDEHHVPDALRQAVEQGLEVEVDIDNATYFVSKITIVAGDAPDMNTWRKKLFLALANTGGEDRRVSGWDDQRAGSHRSRQTARVRPYAGSIRSPSVTPLGGCLLAWLRRAGWRSPLPKPGVVHISWWFVERVCPPRSGSNRIPEEHLPDIVIRTLDNERPAQIVRYIGVALLLVGFHFDLLAS